jgi:hypothetical protein
VKAQPAAKKRATGKQKASDVFVIDDDDDEDEDMGPPKPKPPATGRRQLPSSFLGSSGGSQANRSQGGLFGSSRR